MKVTHFALLGTFCACWFSQIAAATPLPLNYIQMVNGCLPKLNETKFYTAKNQSNRPANTKIDEIVLHDTSSSRTRQWQDAVAYMASPGDGRPVSIHYMVGKTSGQIASLVPEAKVANHVKAGNHNSRSIGIELFKRNGETPYYTDWQYETVAELVYDIMLRQGISFYQVVGHGLLQTNRIDPENFDWTRFENRLLELDDCAQPWTNIYVM